MNICPPPPNYRSAGVRVFLQVVFEHLLAGLCIVDWPVCFIYFCAWGLCRAGSPLCCSSSVIGVLTHLSVNGLPGWQRFFLSCFFNSVISYFSVARWPACLQRKSSLSSVYFACAVAFSLVWLLLMHIFKIYTHSLNGKSLGELYLTIPTYRIIYFTLLKREKTGETPSKPMQERSTTTTPLTWNTRPGLRYFIRERHNAPWLLPSFSVQSCVNWVPSVGVLSSIFTYGASRYSTYGF